MIIDLFSQSYNLHFVISSLDIPDLFPDCKNLPYCWTLRKSYVQRLCVPLNFSLLLRIPFPLTFFNNPVCTCCRDCIQFLFPSIVHQIDYFLPSIVPDKTSQFTHSVWSRFAPSHWSGTHSAGQYMAYMTFGTAPFYTVLVSQAKFSCHPIREYIVSCCSNSL